MTLICKWVKDETGALIMNWTERDSGVSIMKPETRELTQFTVILAKDDGETGAAAKVQSYSLSGAVSLWRVREEPANSIKSRCPVTMCTAHHANSVPHPLGDSMTTHTCTRRPSAPAYYLGRPASFWLATLVPRSASRREFP
jgi:hypothetical protein